MPATNSEGGTHFTAKAAAKASVAAQSQQRQELATTLPPLLAWCDQIVSATAHAGGTEARVPFRPLPPVVADALIFELEDRGFSAHWGDQELELDWNDEHRRSGGHGKGIRLISID